MNAQELGWLAGYLEGEGSFIYSVFDAPVDGRRRTGRFTMYVAATSTDLDVLERVRALAGGRIGGPYDKGGPRKPSWQWRLTRQREARALMIAAQPLMCERRAGQIQACLDAYAAKGVTAPADRTHCPQGHAYVPENTTILSNGWRQCRRCNTDKLRAKRIRDREAALAEPIPGWILVEVDDTIVA